MPDVFTTNEEHLRDALVALGAECGKNARIIKPRDPEWTCHIDSQGWLRDVYIHGMQEIFLHSYYLCFVGLCFIAGIFLGLLWGKRFWQPTV